MERKFTEKERKRAKKVLREIAAQRHLTEAEVRREIMESIRDAMSNPDPAVQARWNAIPWQTGQPTPEEFIFYLTEYASQLLN